MAESSNLDRVAVEPHSTPQEIERGMEDIDMGPLYKAISDNDWPAAEAFVKSHPVGLGHERMIQGWVGLPVQWAIFVGHKEIGRYLYKFTPLHVFTENHERASSFVTLCLTNGVLDIALDLLKKCTELLFVKTDIFHSTIEVIAIHLPDSSLDKSQLPFWKRWIYDYITIPPTTTTTESLNADVQQHGENNITHQGLGLLHRLISSINNLSGMKEIYQMKQQHAQAAEILKLISENLKSLNEDMKSMTQDALIAAAKIDKVEFLLQVTRANPEIILTGSFELFFDAVRYRRAVIFNLLRGFRFKHLVAEVIDEDENEIKLLHLAALLAPSSYHYQVSGGAALELQRELQWFKAAESMVDPAVLNLRNRMNLLASQKQPLDHFKDNHRELRKEGERWLENTATSCAVVGTLILTIMFAAAFTVPGGNQQDSGYPIFLDHKLFKVFLISDALSLFSATTSVLTFLGILTSHYEEDFLYSLPKKLIIGFSTLFLSIATMLVAFLVTIIIMLQHNSSRFRAILPIAVLAGIPIISFVLLQFRVLVQVISSTYGRGTFKEKVDKWP